MQWENLLFGPVGALFFDFSTDCKTGCEPGETTVATDGWGCRSGTYSYFCCSDPNQPASPELPNLNLCYGPDHLDTLTSGLESESNLPNVFEEEHSFDFDCGNIPFDNILDSRSIDDVAYNSSHFATSGQTDEDIDIGFTLARKATPKELLTLGTFFVLEERGSIFKRGARDRVAMALCGPQGQRSSIWVQRYPGATSILRVTGSAFTVAKQGLCATAGITGLSTLSKVADWVTEHVLEKQEFRNALEAMAAGKTHLGNVLRQGAVPFNQVFGANGLFQQDWPSANFPTLAFTHNWDGNINDYFTGLLGRTTDAGLSNRFVDNLQVCDRDFNVYKEYMVAGIDFMSRNLWDKYNPQEKVGILLDVVDMHAYRAQQAVIASFSSTYGNIGTMFDDLTRFAASQGLTYDFRDAWEQIMPDYLNWQVQQMRETFETYLDEEITFWASPLAGNTFTPLVIKEMGDLLDDLKTNIANYITLPVGQMT